MPLWYCRTVTVTSAPLSARVEALMRPIMPLPMTMHFFPATEKPFSSSIRRAVWMTLLSALERSVSVFTRFPAVIPWRKSTSRVWSAA